MHVFHFLMCLSIILSDSLFRVFCPSALFYRDIEAKPPDERRFHLCVSKQNQTSFVCVGVVVEMAPRDQDYQDVRVSRSGSDQDFVYQTVKMASFFFLIGI